MRWLLAAYVAFVTVLVVVFLVWGVLADDPDDQITAFVTAGANAAQGAFCVFLNTGSRRY